MGIIDDIEDICSDNILTTDKLLQIMPKCPTDQADSYVANMNSCFAAAQINTKLRVAAFLSQAAVETNELQSFVENLNYSAQLLMKIWPHRFPTLDIANQYAHHPQKIANSVYSNRLGNGSPESNEGWAYRGRGILQITGKDNYADASQVSGIDLVADPDKAADPQYMFAIAVDYWTKNQINALADQDDIKAVSEAVNGGDTGLADRMRYYNLAKSVL
jgi:putative chitinase